MKPELVDKIIQYEQGDMNDPQEVVTFFQELIDTGMINHLQGHYGRTACDLIEKGYCHPKM